MLSPRIKHFWPEATVSNNTKVEQRQNRPKKQNGLNSRKIDRMRLILNLWDFDIFDFGKEKKNFDRFFG